MYICIAVHKWLVIFLLLLSGPVWAQEGRFVNYTSADGLCSNTVYAITQDAEGFLWIGTRGGLCRFDGARFVAWKGLGRVNALAIDREDRVWAGTTHGLVVKDGESFVVGPEGNVRSLLTDSDGAVWATFGDTTLVKMHFAPGEGIVQDARAPYKKRYSEGDYPYYQIFEDSEGRLWVGGRIVSTQYFADRTNPVAIFVEGEGINCSSSYAQADGKIYSIDDHFNMLRVLEGDAFVNRGRLPISHARLLTDSKGRLWAAGSYGLGLVDTQNPEKTQAFRHQAGQPQSVSSGELFCIFEDRQGNLWVGGDNGLSVLSPALQQVHTLSSGQITAICQTRDGKIWLGTAEDRVSRIYEDSHGTVYVGLWNNTGFQIWEQGKMRKGVIAGPIPERQWKAASGDRRSSNWISDFLEDSRGRFWVVTWEGVGLNEWDRKTGRTLPPQWLSPEWYPSPETDSSIFLSSRLGSRLIEDAAGNLVFGTTEAGFNIIDSKTNLVTKYYKGNSTIPDDYVTDLCLTPDGTIWAATRAGLWSPSGAHFLDGKLVQTVQADASGRLWAGTEEGLYFVAADGSVGRAGKGLGLPSDIYGERVSCRLADGSLAFGGASGAASFHPDSLLAIASAQEIFLTEFSIADAGLRFSFSVQDLPQAVLLQYRYRLSGVDGEWIPAEYPRLQGRYTGLFPGRYKLEIQCSDVFGRWQTSAFTTTFRIHPPLLLRWPFLLLYLLLLVAAGWLFVRYRENRQRARVLQEELDTRNRFFGIISHDLRNPVSGMKMLSSALENAPDDQLRPGIRAIRASAEHTSSLLENLLMWSLGQKGVLRPAMREVALIDIVNEAVGTRKVDLSVPDNLVWRTDPNMLTTCLRNLLDNALRYSPDNVSLVADYNKIVIRDHGPGMDAQTLKTLSRPGHLGLAITKELLEKMGGTLQARNHPEGGCEMTLLFYYD